jgi:FkbM family methyltransferase
MSREYRDKFGFGVGLRVAWGIRKAHYAAHQLSLVPLSIPGLPAPIFLRAQTSDHRVFRSIFLDEELRLPLSFEPRVIVDAGANIGLSALYFARQFPGARIFALELAESNYALLEKNVAALGGVVPRHQALWSCRTTLRLANPQAEHWEFFGVEVRDDSQAGTVAIGVQDLLEEVGCAEIDLLKLDIEGAETEVLSSCDLWLDRVRAIVVELHERVSPGCVAAFEKVVRRWGVTPQVCGEYHFVERPR